MAERSYDEIEHELEAAFAQLQDHPPSTIEGLIHVVIHLEQLAQGVLIWSFETSLNAWADWSAGWNRLGQHRLKSFGHVMTYSILGQPSSQHPGSSSLLVKATGTCDARGHEAGGSMGVVVRRLLRYA